MVKDAITTTGKQKMYHNDHSIETIKRDNSEKRENHGYIRSVGAVAMEHINAI